MNYRGGGGISPAGSVRDFYLENSYSRTDVISTVVEWVTLPNTYAHYANGCSATCTDGLIHLSEGLKYALKQVLDK